MTAPRPARFVIPPSLLLLAVVAAGGCAPTVNVKTWQARVTKYVNENGSGDPSVLREVTLPVDGRRGFSVIGHHDPRDSTDANGLLLAHRQIDGRPWFIYLVGIVDEEKVNDIRLAAMSRDGGRTSWRVGRENDDMLRRYRGHNERLWRRRFPGRDRAPREYLGFPRPEDTFQLTTEEDGTLVATHVPSGAHWAVSVAPKATKKPRE